MRCLDVHIKLGLGDPGQIVSGTSAQADRAVMRHTETACLALPVEIAPKPSPQEPPRTLSNMVAQNTRFLPIRVSIACAGHITNVPTEITSGAA